MDVVIEIISDDDLVEMVDGHTARVIMRRGRNFNAKRIQEVAVDIKRLNTFVVEITSKEVSIKIKGDSMRVSELTWAFALASDRSQMVASTVENLQPLVLVITDDDVVGSWVADDLPGKVELAVSFALGAKDDLEVSLRIKHLDPVVPLVSDEDVVLRIDCNALREVKLARLLALTSKRMKEVSELVKDLDPVVLLVDDDHVVGRVHSDSNGASELAKAASFRPKGVQEVAHDVEGDDPVVSSITNEKVAVVVNHHSF